MLSLVDEKGDAKEVSRIAASTSKAAFIAMLILFLLGVYLFQFFGISTAALKVFGGVILFLMGLNMVQGYGKKVNHNPADQAAAKEREEISIVPLAIPVTVGAGLATTLLTLSSAAQKWEDYLSGVLAIVICSLALLFILKRMPFIKAKLGANGLKVFNRLMGLIVGSLAVQMILSGSTALYQSFFAG